MVDSLAETERVTGEPRVVFPEVVKEDLKQGILRVNRIIETFRPQAIAVLKRSGDLAFFALKEFEGDRLDGVEEVSILIGREISDRFDTSGFGTSELSLDDGAERLREVIPVYRRYLSGDDSLQFTEEGVERVDVGAITARAKTELIETLGIHALLLFKNIGKNYVADFLGIKK